MISEEVVKIEAQRKKLAKTTIICCCLFGGIALVLAIFFLAKKDSFTAVLATTISLIVGGIISFGIISPKLKAYQKSFKGNLVNAVMSDIFQNVTYNPVQCISLGTIQSTRLIKIGNKYSGDDFLSASYKDVGFIQSDLLIQNVVSSGKSTTTYTYFRGKWMIFDFHKPFAQYVQIREKASRFDGQAMVTARPKSERVEMEDIQFNKEFDVFATDQYTAFYLLTPQFVTALRELRDKTKGQMMLGFVDGCLHIAINSGKNSLEAKIFTEITAEIVQSLENELRVITTFIDALALDKGKQLYALGVDKPSNNAKTTQDDLWS